MKKYDLITIILGTRPEAIKLAPLILNLRKSKKFDVRIIFTGQHNEMVKQVMKIFGFNCDLNLNIMRKNQSLSNITNKVIKGLEDEFTNFEPKLVLVQGDTSTAFSAALASFYKKIPVGHVEAGLRTNNLLRPFPEEGNRRLISHLSSIHFAPTELSRQNLLKENVTGKIVVTGNTVIDSLLMISKRELNLPTKKIKWKSHNVLFATIHRRENWGENVTNISKGLLKVINESPNTSLIVPLHLNPKVRNPILKILDNHPRIELTEPLDYEQSIACMKNAMIILTDSGGIQEEAPSLSKPVLVLRESTERIEAVEAGAAKVIGTNPENIYKETMKLINKKDYYLSMSRVPNPYGDGKASERILKACEKFLN